MERPRSSASRCGRAERLARRWAATAALGVMASCAAAAPAAAHGFGQRYELPLPLTLYLYGAAAAVLLSFAVFGLFVRRAPARRTGARVDLLAGQLGRIIGHPAVALLLRLVVLALFVVVILAGLHRRAEPVPQYRADARLDRLVGGVRLSRRLRRRPLGARQPVADDLRRRAMALPAAAAGAAISAWACRTPRCWASGPRRCCCLPSPGSSSSIRTRHRPLTSRASRSPTPSLRWPACSPSAATMAAARRGLLARLLDLRPFRPDRVHETAGSTRDRSVRASSTIAPSRRR